MKKLIPLIIILFLSARVQTLYAQAKLKEGKMTYEITYPESEDMNDQMLAMMPKEMTTWFKDGKTRTEMKMAISNMFIFYDPKTKESVMCTEMMGKKKAVKSTAEDAEKDKESTMGEYDVKITGDTKKIAGYTAKKAIITFKNDHEPMEIWFTDELAAETSARMTWKGISGFPLEYTFEQKNGMGSIKMKLTCTKIEKVAVADDQFNIPEGYTLTTRKEMMQELKDKNKDIKPDTEKKDTLK